MFYISHVEGNLYLSKQVPVPRSITFNRSPSVLYLCQPKIEFREPYSADRYIDSMIGLTDCALHLEDI